MERELRGEFGWGGEKEEAEWRDDKGKKLRGEKTRNRPTPFASPGETQSGRRGSVGVCPGGKILLADCESGFYRPAPLSIIHSISLRE
jgi:hypothetical protein